MRIDDLFPMDENKYKRFNNKNNIFARNSWDEDCPSYKKDMSTALKQRLQDGDAALLFGNAMDISCSYVDNQLRSKLKDTESHLERMGLSSEIVKEKISKIPPSELKNMIADAAKLYGAFSFGVCALDERWNYDGVEMPEGVDRALVMTVKMNEKMMETEGILSSAAVQWGYSTMSIIAGSIGTLITNLGYKAVPCRNDTALSVPMAIEAGLGTLGRNGMLITKKAGSNIRICKVFTDLPLPIDSIDAAYTEKMQKYCRNCKICSDACPTHAIDGDDDKKWSGCNKSNNDGVKKFYVNAELCYKRWLEKGHDCVKCITVCPFSRI